MVRPTQDIDVFTIQDRRGDGKRAKPRSPLDVGDAPFSDEAPDVAYGDAEPVGGAVDVDESSTVGCRHLALASIWAHVHVGLEPGPSSSFT